MRNVHVFIMKEGSDKLLKENKLQVSIPYG